MRREPCEVKDHMRWVVVLILLPLLLAGGLSFCGFCFGQQRFLSDQEFIDAAIRELVSSRASWQPVIEGTFRPPVSGISYVSESEFIDENPDCCSIVGINYPRDSGPQFTMLDRVLGKAAKLVKMRYKYRWTEQGEPKVHVVESYFGLTNCGEVNHARDYWWK
jgi:hypothetical protein